RKNPRDADAYVGLGRAALAMGNYPVARNDFLAAQRIAPDDSSIARTIKLADSVIAIDPTQRGLGLDEQVRRSRQLVQMTIKSAHKCLDIEAPQVAAALDSVARSLVAPAGVVTRAQAVDENISLAAILLGGYALWPGVFIGALVANILTGAPLLTAAGIGIGNTLEPLLAAYALMRLIDFHLAIDRVQDAIGLILLSAGISTLVSATIGVATLYLSGITQRGQ